MVQNLSTYGCQSGWVTHSAPTQPLSLHEFKEVGTTLTKFKTLSLSLMRNPVSHPLIHRVQVMKKQLLLLLVPPWELCPKDPPRGWWLKKTLLGPSQSWGPQENQFKFSPFSPEERALLATHFLIKGRFNINVHTMHKAMYDPNFVTLFRTIEEQAGGNIRRAKHRIRTALRKLGEHLQLFYYQ